MAASSARQQIPTSRSRPDEQIALFFERHSDDVLRFCRAKLRSPADAEDVAQQVFVRAYGALLRGERVRLPRRWLLRIARNECRRHYERVRRVDLVEFDEAIDVSPETEQPRWSPDEIRHALDELVPAQRQAIVLRELEGRTYGEIARELQVTVSAVETLLFRARRALREQLEGAIACGAAERALSLELDGRLPASERPQLRAHLRACVDCRRLARSTRARRGALRTLLPLPLSTSFGEGGAVAVGGAVAGTGVVLKAAAVVTAGAISAGVGLQGAAATKEPARASDRAAAVAAQPARVAAAARTGTNTASPPGRSHVQQTAPPAQAQAQAAPTAAAPVTIAAATHPDETTGPGVSAAPEKVSTPVETLTAAVDKTLAAPPKLPVSAPAVTVPTVTVPTVTVPAVTVPELPPPALPVPPPPPLPPVNLPTPPVGG